ncbi:MAG: hypothetical protein HW388_458 [Dehalococcoidia bacterium]|nr:hypothetical protein [Dehalococcoidia bacterium]
MSLREALLRCFQNEPDRIFGIQDLCQVVQKYYEFTPFQFELDPRHPQPRYEHEVRSQTNRLRRDGYISRLSRNQYRYSPNKDTTP